MPRLVISTLGSNCEASGRGLAVAAPRTDATISLDVKDADIHNVVRLLADTGNVNVVVPDHVRGKVTLKLRHVRWSEALDVVLRTKGLAMERIGSVIHVDTLENLAAGDELRRRIAGARHESAELQTIMIPVSYARAADLAPIVQTVLTDRGSVMVDERSNTLIVTDVAGGVERARGVAGR